MHNVGTVPTFKMHNVVTVPTFKMHNVGIVPTNKTHNIGCWDWDQSRLGKRMQYWDSNLDWYNSWYIYYIRTYYAWTNVAWTYDVWTNVAWTNIGWTNVTLPLVSSQGLFHKLEMTSTVLSLGGLGGWVGGQGKVEINAISAQHSWNWA